MIIGDFTGTAWLMSLTLMLKFHNGTDLASSTCDVTMGGYWEGYNDDYYDNIGTFYQSWVLVASS